MGGRGRWKGRGGGLGVRRRFERLGVIYFAGLYWKERWTGGRQRRRAISLGLTWFLSCGKSADEDGLEPGFNDRYVSEDGSIEKSCA